MGQVFGIGDGTVSLFTRQVCSALMPHWRQHIHWPTGEEQTEMLDSEVQSLIDERQEARRRRDFGRADEIRDELLTRGIILEDTKDGVRWKRK